MASIEDKVIRWFQDEFPDANCKLDPKDITRFVVEMKLLYGLINCFLGFRLVQSKNGHLYIKLFTVLSDHYVSNE